MASRTDSDGRLLSNDGLGRPRPAAARVEHGATASAAHHRDLDVRERFATSAGLVGRPVQRDAHGPRPRRLHAQRRPGVEAATAKVPRNGPSELPFPPFILQFDRIHSFTNSDGPKQRMQSQTQSRPNELLRKTRNMKNEKDSRLDS